MKGIGYRLDWLFYAEKRLLTNPMPRANRHFLPGYVWQILSPV
jgi:hypothetical protein